MLDTDILFTGFYGQKNTGDDAFIEVASWGAKEYWGKTNNRFLAINKKLPITKIPSKGYPFTIPRTYKLQQQKLINHTRYLISGGGSTIHGKMLLNNPKMQAVNRKLKGGEIKIGGIGVSIGPFNSIDDEKAVVEYLSNIDFLAVRDEESYNFVKSLKLPYSPVNAFDLAALLPEIYNFDARIKTMDKPNPKTIGVSVCPFESVQGLNIRQEDERNRKTIELLRRIDNEEEVHFKFYVINGNPYVGDYKLTLKTITEVKPRSFEIVEYSNNTQLIWESIADCDFMISTRLHASIFACFSGTPFMLNEYHRKCSDFLFNIGYDSSYRLFNSEYNTKERANQIIEIINDKSKYLMPNSVSSMKESAKKNFTHIKL